MSKCYFLIDVDAKGKEKNFLKGTVAPDLVVNFLSCMNWSGLESF